MEIGGNQWMEYHDIFIWVLWVWSYIIIIDMVLSTAETTAVTTTRTLHLVLTTNVNGLTLTLTPTGSGRRSIHHPGQVGNIRSNPIRHILGKKYSSGLPKPSRENLKWMNCSFIFYITEHGNHPFLCEGIVIIYHYISMRSPLQAMMLHPASESASSAPSARISVLSSKMSSWAWLRSTRTCSIGIWVAVYGFPTVGLWV